MRKLASIRIIDDVKPIENADRLEQATIGGWTVVVAKGEYHSGEKVVYFEIDSALPVDDTRYEFLKERCLRKWVCSGRVVLEVLRIKTCKLRGVISQGLVMPLNMFPEIETTEVGTDVTELLKVEHYDELAEKYGRLDGSKSIASNAKGAFPTHLVPKTDEERLQNLPEYFDGRMRDILFEVTEKFDGSSATYIYAPHARPDDPFFVCSRNLELKDEEGCVWWDIAKKYDIRTTLECLHHMLYNHAELAIQGEIVGPKMNGNRDMYTDTEFRVFRIYNITQRKWLHPNARKYVCDKLALPHVKVFTLSPVFNTLQTMEDFLKFVEGKTDRGNEREGMVFKSMDGETSFKVINNKYLLKEK